MPPDSSRRDFLHRHLMEHVMPFWLTHAIDEAGGINTCIDDEGRVLSRDKWLWSQWRAVWVFSTLHRDFGGQAHWLRHAGQVMRFCADHGWIDGQGWALRLAHDGTILDGYQSIYVNCFALYGLTAFYLAGGSAAAAALARRTAEVTLEQLRKPHDRIPHFPYPVPPGARVQGIPMLGSLTLWELGRALNEPRYLDAAAALADEIFRDFHRLDLDLVLERVAADGSLYPAPLGTAVVPGHVIENMWFQAHIARDRGDSARMALCWRLIRRHLERGWDPEHGGLLLAIDARGGEEVGWAHADTKLWWPQTETLYALLLAYEHTRQPWFLQWYDRVLDYCLAHYPHPRGEWIQKLDRRGRPITDVVALPVKDPFHLPRALMLSIQSLDRIAASGVET